MQGVDSHQDRPSGGHEVASIAITGSDQGRWSLLRENRPAESGAGRVEAACKARLMQMRQFCTRASNIRPGPRSSRHESERVWLPKATFAYYLDRA
jgi:hypothetical protein